MPTEISSFGRKLRSGHPIDQAAPRGWFDEDGVCVSQQKDAGECEQEGGWADIVFTESSSHCWTVGSSIHTAKSSEQAAERLTTISGQSRFTASMR